MMDIVSCFWSFLGDNPAEIIALSALLLASYQGWAVRRHQRLAVRPHLAFNELYQREPPQLLITLKNEGLGPAIVEKYSVFFDGEEIDTADKNCIVNLCKSLRMKGSEGGGSVIDRGEILAVGYMLPLLRFKTSEETDLNFDNVKAHEEIGRVEIQIRYSSLYGQIFSTSLHNI